MKRSKERKNNRWEGYNYSMSGWYFVTVCVRDFKCVFGRVVNDEMVLNETGEVVKARWLWLRDNFEYVDLDEFIIMPNHMHGIIIIKNINVGTGRDLSLREIKSLSELIGAFKTTSSKLIHQLDINFRWQRSFYDHVIGFDGYELQNIQEYIKNNPAKWEFDRNNKGIW